MKKHNFSAGPSILPASVFEKASQARVLPVKDIKPYFSMVERAYISMLQR